MPGLLDLFASFFGRRPVPPPAPPPPPPIPIPIPPPNPAATPSPLVIAINAARAAHGLPALTADVGLHGSAMGWAAAMASGGALAHGDFAGRIAAVYPGRPSGECIAEGYPDPGSAVAGWMADPPHRAILLGDFALVGGGWATSPGGGHYWVADFAGR